VIGRRTVSSAAPDSVPGTAGARQNAGIRLGVSPMPDNGLAYVAAVYEQLRSRIVHEDTWIQHRVGWLLAANGFLFAAYGTLLVAQARQSHAMQVLVCVVGTLSALLVLFGVIGANDAMKQANREWLRLFPDQEARNAWPQIRSTGVALRLGQVASWGLCISIAAVWLIVLGLSL